MVRLPADVKRRTACHMYWACITDILPRQDRLYEQLEKDIKKFHIERAAEP